MSLVGLANVCSHLQNASKARLGLTSIPMTKLHLRLALGLQKQGIISTVQVAGPEPPLPPQITEKEAARREALENQLADEPWLAYPTANVNESVGKVEVPSPRNIAAMFSYRKKAIKEIEGSFLESLENEMPETERDPARAAFESIKSKLWTKPESTGLENTPLTPETIETLAKSVVREITPSTSTDDTSAPRISSSLLHTIQTTLQSHLNTQISTYLASKPIKPSHEQNPSQIPTNPAHRRIWLGLKYYNSTPVLSSMKLISKPTRRVHVASYDLKQIVRGRDAGQIKGLKNAGECLFLSTDRGIWESRECAEKGVGGVALCRVL